MAWRLREEATAGIGTIVDVDASQSQTGLDVAAHSETTAQTRLV
jgi:hypothetical protein